MRLLFRRIKSLVGVGHPPAALRGTQLAELNQLSNAWLLVEGERIHSFGSEDETVLLPEADQVIDCTGRFILPSFCDSHTHLVFAASREEEFVDKIRGKTYAEIAAKGGGILSSARKLAALPEEQLFRESMAKLEKVAAAGTGAIEIKSGYGLSVAAELKMLRVIKQLKYSSRIPIKASFLGAHAIPPEFKENREGYIRLLIDDILPVIEQEGLADFIDVFCEEGFFTPDETIRICEAGKTIGLRPKIHANQLTVSGGVEAGIKLDAISVDHLESMAPETIAALAASNVIGTLLPTAAYFLRMPPPPARLLLEAGAALALASDFNPGSSPSFNMEGVVSMACIQLRMLPEEALQAATINGAFAMQLEKETGTIHPGKWANLLLTKPLSSLAYIPYSFGASCLHQVYLKGSLVKSA
ncbi:imidazolonepropionase [Flavihumibacter sp. CACIAM 22H1]|uniref:imidazolonepropionase n=1 Tax=Flavihumibacter sp. CACIAM 22H1 TaxID=1812911 RepID=UPI0007A8F618|nr:imidazolonepropionase [Flavihumibacter sp. CACIAM 22H1]KYP12966.1 MAG: imidazolonepropionase [Flavihumibacter sp. CACIAM 22H1]